MTLDLFTARCLTCGLLVRHHRGARNETLSCAEAKRRHPRAQAKRRNFRSLLALSSRQEAQRG